MICRGVACAWTSLPDFRLKAEATPFLSCGFRL